MTATFLNCQKYVPQEVSLEETISWVFLTEKLPLTGIRCFSEVF
jgi:hypothetical protein